MKDNEYKGKAIHGVDKIPDFILLKEANIEIGKLKSYIDELESKLKYYEKNATTIETTKLNSHLKNCNKRNDMLRAENKRYQEQLFNLIKINKDGIKS